MTTHTPTPGAKMIYLIKRREETSREALIAHWFAHHMPDVIASQISAKASGGKGANRYVASLFQPGRDGSQAWDGMAQLWWDDAVPYPADAHGSTPRDTFQQKAEPYLPWATTEYVIQDGELSLEPNTLNEPFPCTRSGLHKVTFLVETQDGTDHDAFFAHWLDAHVTNVSGVLAQTGGHRYVVSHSINPDLDRYAGMAEIYFEDASGWKSYNEIIKPDGMEQWVGAGTVIMRGTTEMIGIP